MVVRYLITTAEEQTWMFDRPVLFLGEWCRRYNRKQVWENMDAIVALPYGLEKEQRERDFDYIRQLSNALLHELTEALNLFHQADYSLRFWHIVLGHWLNRYVRVIFNRYFTLEQALNNYSICGTSILTLNDDYLAKLNSLDFIWACGDDIWNHHLYARILTFLGKIKKEEFNVVTASMSSRIHTSETPASFYYNKKYMVQLLATRILPILSRKKDAFVLNSYLPRLEEIKLAIFLGQCPQFWRSPPLRDMYFDKKKRACFKLNTKNCLGFELFIRQQMHQILPICYLEGFEQLIQQVKALPWPQSPKFIFTSNSFDTDEIFKVWAACKIESGVPYYVGQHGNNYGTLKESIMHPETLTCDKFFSWGWRNGNIKNIPAFIFKRAGCTPVRADPKGGLLLILCFLPHRFGPGDLEYEYSIYQEEQFKFVDALPAAIQKKLSIRLHASWRKTKWFDDQRWKDRYPSLNIELGTEKIDSLIKKSRLVIHSYDSTGMLETLARNIPTICFWKGGLDHLLPSAKPFYERLREVSIIVDTPGQAAKLIVENWDDVDKWWLESTLQAARINFCEKYARIDKKCATTLKHLLINEVSVVE